MSSEGASEFESPAARARYLVELVDAQFDDYRQSDSATWRELYEFGPGTRAEWFCVLGDRAATRGDEAEAARRYQLAIDQGCRSARARLAHLRACDGYRRLRGDGAGTKKQLGSAVFLVSDEDHYHVCGSKRR